MVDDRPFPSASPTNNANSSSPSNSDFEQISASSSINSMNSGGNSGGSSGVGVTATNVNAAMNNENNGSAEQVTQTEEATQEQQVIEVAKSIDQRQLAKENELLRKQLEELKRGLAKRDEEKEVLERELDQNRSVMAKVLKCQIEAKRKEEQQRLKATTMTTKNTLFPITIVEHPAVSSDPGRDIWMESNTSAATTNSSLSTSSLLPRWLCQLPTSSSSQVQQKSALIRQAHQQPVNQSAPLPGLPLKPNATIIEALEMGSRRDLFVHLQNGQQTMDKEVLDCFADLLILSNRRLHQSSGLMMSTLPHSNMVCVVLIPNRVDYLSSISYLYLTWLQEKDVSIFYRNEGLFRPNCPEFWFLTCEDFLAALVGGELNLQNLRFLLLHSLDLLIDESDFARSILDIQACAREADYQIVAFSRTLSPQLMAIVPNILRPGHFHITSSSTRGPPQPEDSQNEALLIDLDADGEEGSSMRTIVAEIAGDEGTMCGEPRHPQHLDIWEEPPDENDDEEEGVHVQPEEDVQGHIQMEGGGGEGGGAVVPDRDIWAEEEEDEEEVDEQLQAPNIERGPFAEQLEQNTVSTSHDLYESALESFAGSSRSSPSPVHPQNAVRAATGSSIYSLPTSSTQNTSQTGNRLGHNSALQFAPSSGSSGTNYPALTHNSCFSWPPAPPQQPHVGPDGLIDTLERGMAEMREQFEQFGVDLGAQLDQLERRADQLEGEQQQLAGGTARPNRFIEDLLVDFDIRLDEAEERLGMFNGLEQAPEQIDRLAVENGELRERMAQVERRVQLLEQCGGVRRAFLMDYANSLGQKSWEGALVVRAPFAYSEDFKKLVLDGGSLGFRGIVVNTSAQLQDCPAQFLDQIIQHAWHSASLLGMLPFLVLNFPQANKPQWPQCLLDVRRNVDNNNFLVGDDEPDTSNSDNGPLGMLSASGTHGTRIKKRSVQADKVVYSFRNEHNRAINFVLEVYFEPPEEIYRKARSFIIRCLQN